MSRQQRNVRFLAGIILLAGFVGCGSGRPETIPVSGKITFDGDEWPAEALLLFGCTQPAEGFPTRPGRAVVARDGSFRVGTFDDQTDGLMPGTYQAYVVCEGVVGGKTVSLVPAKYQTGSTSGLELFVECGSRPITLSWDVSTR